jgi:hypothetical protein
MLLNGRLWFTLLMLGIFVVMVAVAWGYPPNARFMPLVIGIPGIVLALGQLVLDALGPSEEPAEQPRGGSLVRRELVMLASLFALVASVVLLGFWISIPTFMFLFLVLHERERVWFALLLAAAGTAVFYLIFERMMSVGVHEGLVTRALLDRLAQ